MQTRNPIFEELARLTSGAVSTLAGVRAEIDTLVRQQLERLLGDMNLVPRDEFEAVKAMAAKARAEQERLEARIAELEAKIGEKPPRRTSRSRKTTAKRAPSKN